jgi:ornithine carbamoyltransferase
MRHVLTLLDLSREEIWGLLTEATRLKQAMRRGVRKPLLQGRVLGMVFEKPSLRTRVSFQTGMAQLGGASVFLAGNEVGLGTRETIPDFARTLCGYVDAVVLRVFHHATVEQFAQHASVPVINGLSDYHHPCQALGDLLTMTEAFGDIAGRTLAFIGDGNNVARSLAICCGKLGVQFILSSPEGYSFDTPFLEAYRQAVPEGVLIQNNNPAEAVRSADIVYTDVWTSMGQEQERDHRLSRFAGFQVNTALMGQAPSHARFMHCLPAHRGEEVSDEIMDGDQSVVFPQAENRLHAQKALLVWLLDHHEKRNGQPRGSAVKRPARKTRSR